VDDPSREADGAAATVAELQIEEVVAGLSIAAGQPENDETAEKGSGDDCVRRVTHHKYMDEGGTGHRARQEHEAGCHSAWNQQQESADDFHDAGAVAKPLADPYLSEERDPWSARARREFVHAEENESESDASAEDPVSQVVAGFVRFGLVEHGGISWSKKPSDLRRAFAPVRRDADEVKTTKIEYGKDG
jgi:hypothetical protein